MKSPEVEGLYRHAEKDWLEVPLLPRSSWEKIW
jgi:hypothetical protein